jgi:FkbM family methyltransferase
VSARFRALSLLTRINRPEYVFRPDAAIRRIRLGAKLPGGSGAIRDVKLRWGQTIDVFPDHLGRALIIGGIVDLPLTESIHRLLDPGGLAVDAGANIGYVTNLMATRLGAGGRVMAFEPHPTVFQLLEQNVTRWNADPSIGKVECRRLAVSNESGSGRLSGGGDVNTHMGLASLRNGAEAGRPDDFDVELETLDDVLGDGQPDLIKIDVEGHEWEVLEGAGKLLAERRVRDVVFEDHGIYPTPAMTLLEEHGMTIFTLTHSLLGPRLRPVREGPAPGGWPGPNYLATLDPARASARLAPRGWGSLGSKTLFPRSRR